MIKGCLTENSLAGTSVTSETFCTQYLTPMSGAGISEIISGSFSANINATSSQDSTGIFQKTTTVSTPDNLSMNQEIILESGLIKFIEDSGELKPILDQIIQKVYLLTTSRNKIMKIIFRNEEITNKIGLEIYISNKTNGFIIDLNNDINSIIFDEAQQILDNDKKAEILSLFEIKIFDLENELKL